MYKLLPFTCGDHTVFSPIDKETGFHKTFTFVKFYNPEDADSALKAMSGTVSTQLYCRHVFKLTF